MPRRTKRRGARQQPKRRAAAAKALGGRLYRQRVVPNKKRDVRWGWDAFNAEAVVLDRKGKPVAGIPF